MDLDKNQHLVITDYEPAGHGFAVRPVFGTAAQAVTCSLGRRYSRSPELIECLQALRTKERAKDLLKKIILSPETVLLKAAQERIARGYSYSPESASKDCFEDGVFMEHSNGQKIHLSYVRNVLFSRGFAKTRVLAARHSLRLH